MIEEDAHIAVDGIMEDLFSRKGFSVAWNDTEEQGKQDIAQMMYNHIMHALLEQKEQTN
jgi:hypothetical protein